MMARRAQEYCSLVGELCMPLDDWGTVFDISGVAAGLLVAGFGLYKAWEELRRLRQQRDKESTEATDAARLKRTEFLLAQHRRLFDDAELRSVLALLDADDPRLTQWDMWALKRKFLTFIEEIQLLVEAGLLNGQVAHYMFGYYALRARDGPNFGVGIDPAGMYWQLFYDFCSDAERYFESFDAGSRFTPTL